MAEETTAGWARHCAATFDLSGLAAISINAASFMYHMPQHFISDTRPEMLAWLRARGLPPPSSVDELRRTVSKWHKELKPDLARLMRDLAILKRARYIFKAPVYKTYAAHARSLALSSGGSDPSMALRCDVASLCYAGEVMTEYSEFGANANTLKKDDRAWEFWEHVCERVGTNPMRTPQEVRENPERQAWLLAILMLYASFHEGHHVGHVVEGSTRDQRSDALAVEVDRAEVLEEADEGALVGGEGRADRGQIGQVTGLSQEDDAKLVQLALCHGELVEVVFRVVSVARCSRKTASRQAR